MKEGLRGEEQWLLLGLRPPLPPLRLTYSPNSSARTSLPTSVVARKANTAGQHLVSSRRSQIGTADSTLQSHSSPLPQDLLLGLPLGADLEQVAPCLRPAGERRALSAGSALRPIQALPGEAATSLQLVEPRGEPLRATRSGSIRLLPARHLVLFRGGRASSPHLHGNLSPEVRAGSGEWHRMCLRLLAIPPCGRLPPPLQAWPRAPPDLSGNVWPGARTSGRCQAPPTPCA